MKITRLPDYGLYLQIGRFSLYAKNWPRLIIRAFRPGNWIYPWP